MKVEFLSYTDFIKELPMLGVFFGCKVVCTSVIFHPLVTTRFSHHHHLGETIFILGERAVDVVIGLRIERSWVL